MIDNATIESFLEGSNPMKYVVAIEAGYSEPKVDLVINDPESGKKIVRHPYKPFVWVKEDVFKLLYGGKRMKISEAQKRFNIKTTRLRTANDDGYSPPRMENGFKFLVTCNGPYNDLARFFKQGGVDMFHKDTAKLFVKFSPVEQFMIQSGIRLFKGMDDYNDVHRFQFDLETTGLFAWKDSIFQIGCRDNRGMEKVLETIGDRTLVLQKEEREATSEEAKEQILAKLLTIKDTPQEQRKAEREAIAKFFKIIEFIKPDIITGYNSENFDWAFLFERAERLGIDITELAITLNRASKIKRKPSTVKFGGETENYLQTNMWGYNILDISHAVRRAMAINSEIKAWGLKYITQYSDIAKPNRVYVAGDKINTTWADKVNKYAFNDKNGDWYMITDKKPLKEGYQIKKGDYIVQRYLQDDLWETEQIDNLFNQASFLIGKMLPTDFQRSSTMGTAGQWKLIMSAWSYENGLAIPATQDKRDFTGGLSRLLELGFAKWVAKLDFAALYPKIQLTHGIFPDLDISGVMEGMLTYVVDTRDKFKNLNGSEKKKYKKLGDELDKHIVNMSDEEIEALKLEITNSKSLANFYDKKQLPLKILANSWFGSYGAPYIFNWGDTDSAEETTCRGRQYLRLMVKFFTEKYGFTPLVLDTDGVNFKMPANIDEITYLAKGSHWKTADSADKLLTGLDAVLAEFNETYMEGRMGLDIDDICNSTINFSRKNYANDIDGKIKLVGNSVKSKKMAVYIEDFLGKGIRMLLDGDGQSFIEHYYDYVDKIYNYQIPLVKIASKSKVKSTITEYKKRALTKNKAGNPMPKQAHMELAIKDGIDVTLGDTLFYINTGKVKSHGDLKSVKDKETGETTVTLNCKLIDPEVVEKDFEKIKELEMLKKALVTATNDGELNLETIESRIKELNSDLFTDEYNVDKYLDAFNKKVTPLLVCFSPEVRHNILLKIVNVKDKVTKTTSKVLSERRIFTKPECELVSGIANKPTDQDSYEELMTMEDKEIRFWDSMDMLPNNMLEEEWVVIRADYHERMRIARENGIIDETARLDKMFKQLEVSDLDDIQETGELPLGIYQIVDVDDDNFLVSRKWDEQLFHVMDIFKYMDEAIERDDFYLLRGIEKLDNRYELFLEYKNEELIMKGDISDSDDIPKAEIKPDVVELIKNKIETIELPASIVTKKKRVMLESVADDEDEPEVDENGKIIRNEELQLDDEIDDTQIDVPEGYIIGENNYVDEELVSSVPAPEEQEFDWGF